MKRTVTWLSVLFLTILSLCAYTEDEQEASLTIGCFPSDLCGRYAEFTPDEDTRRQLLGLLAGVDFIDMSHDNRAFPDFNEVSLGITLSYEGFTVDLRTGGWIRRHETDGLGLWFAQDTNIVDYVTNLLAEKGYEPFDPAVMKTIVSAELCDGEYTTGKAHESIVLRDPVKLEKLQNLLVHSTLADPSGCPFGYAKLVIIDSEGSQFELYPATDSCCRYFINGFFFSYDASRGDEEHDLSQILFDLFGIEPFDYYHNAG